MNQIYGVIHDLKYLRDQGDDLHYSELIAASPHFPTPPGLDLEERQTEASLPALSADLAERLTKLVQQDDFVLIMEPTQKGPEFKDPWALIATAAEVIRARVDSGMYLHAWSDYEGLAPNFVVHMKARGPLKILSYWGRARFLAPNVIDVRNMVPVEDHGRTFTRKELAWKNSYITLATMQAEPLRTLLNDHFLKHINPKMDNAVLVNGEEDAIIADADVQISKGTVDEFKAAMQWLVDSWPEENAALDIVCASSKSEARAYGPSRLEALVDEIVLEAVTPTGYGYQYNDGPSHCKSGYSYSAYCFHVRRGQVSAHEMIDARSRFCDWLTRHGVDDPEGAIARYEARIGKS